MYIVAQANYTCLQYACETGGFAWWDSIQRNTSEKESMSHKRFNLGSVCRTRNSFGDTFLTFNRLRSLVLPVRFHCHRSINLVFSRLGRERAVLQVPIYLCRISVTQGAREGYSGGGGRGIGVMSHASPPPHTPYTSYVQPPASSPYALSIHPLYPSLTYNLLPPGAPSDGVGTCSAGEM